MIVAVAPGPVEKGKGKRNRVDRDRVDRDRHVRVRENQARENLEPRASVVGVELTKQASPEESGQIVLRMNKPQSVCIAAS